MSENQLTIIALISPAAFLIAAIASWFQPGLRPQKVITISKIATIISLIIVTISCISAFKFSLLESNLIGINNFGFSIRLDSLTVIMLTMISLLAFIIIKFSINYLDGDQKQGAFLGRLSATIASVQLLVLAGNLGLLLFCWILTSISLHRLLLFYPERRGAQIAAKKKFILARLGDVCLLVAICLLYTHYGSGNLEFIFKAIKNGSASGNSLIVPGIAALFLALTAILKSAQFPTHGWLIEVMETPTPVSALLHAGLLNAGPFLIIRMAYVMEASTVAPVLLMVLGGFTALFASVVYLTQTCVKTALGYSSVGHMGFSLLLCGLGLYPAALLHVVAHSFYKAHAFLSSGSAIDVLRGAKVVRQPKSLSPLKIILGFAMAIALYSFFAALWGIDPKKEFPLLVIGFVIFMGLARLFTSSLANQLNSKLITQTALLALLVTIAFFSLESGTHFLLSSQIPVSVMIGMGRIIASVIILLTFSAAVFVQIIAPQLSQKPFYKTVVIHVRNGFYANALFDKLLNALAINSNENTNRIKSTVFENHKTTELKEQKEQLV